MQKLSNLQWNIENSFNFSLSSQGLRMNVAITKMVDGIYFVPTESLSQKVTWLMTMVDIIDTVGVM